MVGKGARVVDVGVGECNGVWAWEMEIVINVLMVMNVLSI